MNPERPTDPREQLEVRITALLLGEASAFEEAELLEAIQHDPALAAYYEEMRQMVKRVEETIQLAPMVESVAQPKLADARRDQLQELFKQAAPAKTIKLESPADRVRRLGWLQHAAAIAAAMTILAAVVWMLLPGYSKAKSKGSMLSMLFPQERFIDQLGGASPSAGATTWEMSTNRAGDRRSADFFLESSVESIPQRDNAGEVSEATAMDERFLARYGSSEGSSRNRRPVRMQIPEPARQPPAPVQPADIYLPSASVDTAGAPVQMQTDGAERGLATDNTVRYYFSDSGLAAAKDLARREVAAVVADSPTLAFAVPDVSATPPAPAAQPTLQTQAGRPEQLTDSLARKGDAATESEVMLGKKLAPAPESAVKSEVRELRSVLSTGAKDSYVEDETRRRQLSIAESRFDDFSNAGLSAGGARGRVAGASRGAQVDGLATFVTDPNQLAAGGIGGGGGYGRDGFGNARGWGEGRPAAGLATGAFAAGQVPAPGGPANAPAAANTWHANFGGIAAAPAVDSYGLNVAADDFAINGQAGAALFAKQQADTKSGERLNRLGEETSLGLAVKEARVPAESMYQEGLRTEQRQLDRDRVEELSKQDSDFDRMKLTARFIEADGEDKRLKELGDQVSARGESAGRAEVELKRKAAEPEWLGVLEQPQAGAVISDRQELQTREFKVDPKVFYEGLEGVLANSVGARDAVAEARPGAPSFQSPVFAQISIAQADRGQDGDRGLRFLTATNDMSSVNAAVKDFFEAVGVSSTPPNVFFYNDRTGTLMVRAPESELGIVQQAVEILNYSPPRGPGESTQSRFDTLADFSSAEFAMAADNGREQQVRQWVESDLVATPEVAKLAEEVVEAQPATPPPPSLEPLPEIRTLDNAFSTFSLNVSDVSFQLAASSLENGQMPDGARLRSEEFINAFDYRDPMPAPGQRVAFNWERARNPFAHNRELLRFSVQTAAAGREPGQPLNLVLLVDNSGSMERADRVQITEQMLRVLAAGLNDYDRISVISFARTPRLIVDGMPGGNHQALLDQITGLNPDGGTNLEDALKLGYETAAKHFQANGNNRVIVITDGAANLGNVDPAQLRERVIDQRKRGIALDCFGVGFEGYNDNLLEALSRNGDGRYGFLNDAENAPAQFASQLNGALQVAAADVKAQVEFNPNRVTVYRQIGYQQHQLTKEQFRDNTVDAAEIGAAEAGNALYSIEVNPNGSGPIGTFRARYRVPSTGQYEEKEWVLDYTPGAPELESSGAAMRLASTSAAFAEWLANSPYAQSVTPDALQNLLRDVPETFAPDPRPAKLQAMIQQARAISGR